MCFILKVVHPKSDTAAVSYGLEPALCKSSPGIPRAKKVSMGPAGPSETYWMSEDLLALVKLNVATPKFIQLNSLVHFSKSTDWAEGHAAQAQHCTHASKLSRL